MSEVIDALLEDHANLAKLLDAVERQIALFDAGEAPDYDVIQGVLEYCLSYPDLYHHPKENLVYERLCARDPGAAEALGDLMAEHRDLAEATGRFAETVRVILQDLEVPREALDTTARRFIAFYREHMAREEEELFPAALRALTRADWAEIDARMAARHDPLFGPESEERFAALRRNVLTWAAESA